jgi:hypothetical protein
VADDRGCESQEEDRVESMKVRPNLELILTPHAVERLNDHSRCPVTPELPLDEEVRLFQFRHPDTKETVWICQIRGGFLVGQRRITKRRQMLVAMTALNKEMFKRSHYVRLACHRVTVDKITEQAS